MNLLTNYLQAYERNQNLAGWVQQTEQSATETARESDQGLQSDEVTISAGRDIYDWIAQSLPLSEQNSAGLSQLSQQLYDYSLITHHHQATLNKLRAESPDAPILSSIENALSSSTSYRQSQNLKHVAQVFSNLIAAHQSQQQ